MNQSRSTFLGMVSALALCASSQAGQYDFFANLSGPNEFPANASPGTGFVLVSLDDTAHTMHVQVTFGGLIANTTASHIHAATTVPLSGTAGVATQTPSFSGFPLGATSGIYDHTFDLTLASSFNGSYVTANGGTAAGAETALLNAMLQEKAYYNIHTTAFPGGEIRGFLIRVPDGGSTAALLGLALLGLGATRRSLKRSQEK